MTKLTLDSTNNGVIYVLDKILARDPTPATGVTPSTTDAAPGSSSSKNAAERPSAKKQFSLAVILAGTFALL